MLLHILYHWISDGGDSLKKLPKVIFIRVSPRGIRKKGGKTKPKDTKDDKKK